MVLGFIMADEGLVNIANQFSGLDMASLIGGPLQAACNAQMMLAKSTMDFIETVGLEAADANGVKKCVQQHFPLIEHVTVVTLAK